MSFAVQCHIQPAINIRGGGLPKLVSAAKPVSTWRTSPISNRYCHIPILYSSSPILAGSSGGGAGRGNWKIFSGGDGYGEDDNQGPIGRLLSLTWTIIVALVPFSYLSLLNKLMEGGIQLMESANKKLRNLGYRPSVEENPATSGKSSVM